jgi:DNA-binding MarR family transcriptional regulator
LTTSDTGPSDPAYRDEQMALQARRWASLGRLLGFASGLFNYRVIEAVRALGFSDLRQSHSHLMRSMQLEGSRITALADRASITKQAMSGIVAEMEALGYVTTTVDPADGRAKLVTYTELGRQMVGAIVQSAEQVEGEYNRVLGERRAKQFRRSLEMLFEALTPEDVADAVGWVDRDRSPDG